ncbi:MAG: LysR family transcriptional regulator [Oscillospiraceae bacterium]|nr:LysR family transcriptional regulator [Oscillospiraceae bacterium]
MSMKKYEVFVKTARLGSLTKAAEALGSTQSRISHVIKDLEEGFGFSLMLRGRGGVQLTQAGQLLLPMMEQILRQNEQLQELAAEIRSADTGTVRIGAFTSVAVHWLPGMIRTFQSEHPKAELQMLNGDYHDMELWLKNGDIDLGFVSLPAPAGVKTIPLSEDPLVAILPKGHALARMHCIPIEAMTEDPFISLLQSSSHDIHRALDKAGVRPNIKYTTKDDYAILAMVEQGLGISIVPQLLIKDRTQNLEVRPLSPAASRTIALAVPEGDLSPVAQAFIETAQNWLYAHK